MVQVLGEAPGFHATFNIVPGLGIQLEEYASGKFNEPWFTLAFKPSEELNREDKAEILARAFQVNHDRLMSRWPRFVELFEWSRPAGGARAQVTFTTRDCAICRCFPSLPGWMKFGSRRRSGQQAGEQRQRFQRADKSALKAKQLEFLVWCFRRIAKRPNAGRSKSAPRPSIIPFCRCCAIRTLHAWRIPERAASPSVSPAPGRARAIASRARVSPARLWREAGRVVASEGSVSDQALTIAMEEGFEWFGTDEGVLAARSMSDFFATPPVCLQLRSFVQTYRVQLAGSSITGLFRDHHLSDLIGFVYSRMDGKAAAADLHGRLRLLGERVPSQQPLTVCLFLDGENAWEYYPGNGREFLRDFYARIQNDQDFRALTASEAIAAAKELPAISAYFRLRGSTQTSTCGLATPRTLLLGSCCGMRARPTREPPKLASKTATARQPKQP